MFGDSVDADGHGTHVAGSIAGQPYSGASPDDGMAPKAKLVFSDLGTSGQGFIYTPSNLAQYYYPDPYERGAKIHSDSWSDESLAYDTMAREVDLFTWEHPDFLPIFSAGNFGDSSKHTSTVTAPATAKNSIAVGATLTEGQAFSMAKGYTEWVLSVDVELPAGGVDSRQFRLLQANFGPSFKPLTSQGKIELAFAEPEDACSPLSNGLKVSGKIVVIRRGDCKFVDKVLRASQAGAKAVIITNNVMDGNFILGAEDGSSEPTIPAGNVPLNVGLFLWSRQGYKLSIELGNAKGVKNAFDNVADFSSFGPTIDKRYKPDIVAPGYIQSAASGERCGETTYSGTSMAAGIVSGGAALIRQYFVDKKNYQPSGMLVKAVMLGGAQPMQGYTEMGYPLEPPPSSRQGYGRLNLERSLAFQQGWSMQVVDLAPLNLGESHKYCVKALGGPLYITLVWHDFPGSVISRKALVNDLDLSVRAAGLQGEFLRGNGQTDRTNNVEQVSLEVLPAGDVSIEVTAYRVFSNEGPQKYALVVLGSFSGTLASEFNPDNLDNSAQQGTCIISLPEITSGPQGLTSNNSPSFQFTTQSRRDPPKGFECRLSTQTGEVSSNPNLFHDWKKCESPTTYSQLGDGSYAFSVRAFGEEVADTRLFDVDATPPQTQLLSSSRLPEEASAIQLASVYFVAIDSSQVKYQCKLSTTGDTENLRIVSDVSEVVFGDWVNCSSPFTILSMGVGDYNLGVRGMDGAGNIEKTYPQQSWTVALKPDIIYARILESPWGLQPTKNASFLVQLLQGNSDGSGTEIDSPILCRLNVSTWQECSNPVFYNDLDDGQYRFEVQSLDQFQIQSLNNNANSRMDVLSIGYVEFAVDTVAPEIQWEEDDVPEVFFSTVSIFRFKSNEEVVTYQCKLIALSQQNPNQKFQNCNGGSGTAEYTDLVDGEEYQFMVQATDQVGNIAQPLIHQFKIDASPPVISNVTYPEATNLEAIIVSFSAEDPNNGTGIGDMFCRLFRLMESQNQSEWFQCTSPLQLQVPDEAVYGFGIRVLDLVNQSTSQDYQITVERSPPTAQITTQFDTANPVPSQFSVNWTGEDVGDVQSGIHHAEIKITLDSEPIIQKRRLQQTVNGNNGANSGTLDIKVNVGGKYFGLDEWISSADRPIILKEVPSGVYMITLRGVDLAGNIGNETNGTLVKVDSTIVVVQGDKDGEDGPNLIIILCVICGCILLAIIGIVFIIYCSAYRRQNSIQRQQSVRQQRQQAQQQQQQIVDVDAVRLQNAIELSTIDQMSQQAREEADIRAAIQASLEEQNVRKAMEVSLYDVS